MTDLLHARVVDSALLGGFGAELLASAEWTAIIPAAGRGSRLGYDKPKLLYPVAGRTILEWLIDELGVLCGRFVFVLSPSGVPLVESELERLVPSRWTVVLQSEPLGMADAVAAATGRITTPYSLVVWGDQVGVRSSTIRACMRAHQMRANAVATCPTVLRDKPYIHFERDDGGRLTSILQAREGDNLPQYGESDCGVFLFGTEALFGTLARMRSMDAAWGRQSKEFNLLPILPLLDHEAGNVCCVRIQEVEQSIGINTANEAAAAGASLLSRRRRGPT